MSGRYYDDRGVVWGNGWAIATAATVAAFKEAWGLVSVGLFPLRNFGGRTPVMVRSMLHSGFRHVF